MRTALLSGMEKDIIKEKFAEPTYVIGVKGGLGTVSLDRFLNDNPNLSVVKRWKEVYNPNYMNEEDPTPKGHILQPAILVWKDEPKKESKTK